MSFALDVLDMNVRVYSEKCLETTVGRVGAGMWY